MSGDLDERLSKVLAGGDVDELIELGCDAADAGRQVDAERCFRRAAERGSAAAWFNLGNSLVALERAVEAVAAYLRAVAGGITEAWLNLGLTLEALGDRVAAIQAFRSAVEVGDAYGGLALAYLLDQVGEVAPTDRSITGPEGLRLGRCVRHPPDPRRPARRPVIDRRSPRIGRFCPGG